MKWFSKINRGVILTVIVITGVVIYLVSLSISQSRSIPELKKLTEEYIQLDVKYAMLPEEYRNETPDITKDELDSFIQEMEEKLSVFYPDEEQYSEFAVKNIAAELTKQSKGQGVILSYEKEIVEFSNFVFKEDTVTVSVLTDTSIETTAQDDMAPYERGKMADTGKIRYETDDILIFMRYKGEWKLIHAQISDVSGNPGEPMHFR